MFYAYLLRHPSEDRIYIGYTGDLRRRFAQHQALARHAGWNLVYYEAYRSQEDAMERERKLRSLRFLHPASERKAAAEPGVKRALEWAG